MTNLEKNSDVQFTALVIGATGGIGHAFLKAFENDPLCKLVDRIDRKNYSEFDLRSEEAIERAIEHCLPKTAEYDVIIDATGALEISGVRPERSHNELSYENMNAHFQVNTIGPALLLKHLAPRLRRGGRAVYAKLGARVGSITDNELGGWVSYRASKAALCQVIKTAAIEIGRKQPNHIIVALHPGTVETPLSANYRTKHEKLTPKQSVEMLLDVVAGLKPEQTGAHLDYKGEEIAG